MYTTVRTCLLVTYTLGKGTVFWGFMIVRCIAKKNRKGELVTGTAFNFSDVVIKKYSSQNNGKY